MNKFQFLTRKIIYPTSLIFTVLSMAVLLLVNLVDSSKPALSISTAGILLLLSLLISFCNLIFSLRQFTMLTRVLLHFPAVLLVTAGVMMLNPAYDLTVDSLVLVLLFAVLYALVVPPVLLISAKLYQKNAEEKTYTSIFSPRD
ncbi:MAG: DUF3021 family protein [Clostridia bacterium]|nr:DUF3021 family protein [Clostridia bacterium]